ncbi:MAG: DUF4160 domain-containing protein [Bacteroidaceae bacterium]
MWRFQKNNIFAKNIILSNQEKTTMPEICRFYGIIIKMFFKPKEHDPAHIHAIYNEYVGIFDIHTFQMIDGDLPLKAQGLVKEWLEANYDKLIEMWNTQVITKLEPLQ